MELERHRGAGGVHSGAGARKNSGVALRMGVGVLIIGLAAVFVLNILGWALGFLLSLLWVAVWVAIVYGLIVVAGKAIKGAG